MSLPKDHKMTFLRNPTEPPLGVLGTRYLDDNHETAGSKRAFAVVSNQRIYVVGQCFVRRATKTVFGEKVRFVPARERLDLRLAEVSGSAYCRIPSRFGAGLLWTAFCVLLLGLSHWYSTATSITRHVSFGAEGTIALLFGVLGSVIGAITMVLGSKRAIKLTFADGSMVAMPIAWYGEEEVEQFRSALSAGQKLAATPSSPGTPPPSNRGTQDDGELKTCPYCAEQIKAKAIKCKHCGQQVTV